MKNQDVCQVDVKKDEKGAIISVGMSFGPHHFLEVYRRDDGGTEFVIGATHHGFRADASVPGGELETFIEEIRRSHPGHTID